MNVRDGLRVGFGGWLGIVLARLLAGVALALAPVVGAVLFVLLLAVALGGGA